MITSGADWRMKNYLKESVRLIEKMGEIMSSKEILVSIALGSEDIRIGELWFHIYPSSFILQLCCAYLFDSSLTPCQLRVSQSTRVALQNEILGSIYFEVDWVYTRRVSFCNFVARITLPASLYTALQVNSSSVMEYMSTSLDSFTCALSKAK